MKNVQNESNKTKAPGKPLEPERKSRDGAGNTVTKEKEEVYFTKQTEKMVKLGNLKYTIS